MGNEVEPLYLQVQVHIKNFSRHFIMGGGQLYLNPNPGCLKPFPSKMDLLAGGVVDSPKCGVYTNMIVGDQS